MGGNILGYGSAVSQGFNEKYAVTESSEFYLPF